MRKINLKKIINKLYSEDLYYISIPPIHSDYEETYHEVTIDPDGKKRFLLEEREHNIKGMPEITVWVNNMPRGKILDDKGISPSFYGSNMTFLCSIES